MAVYCQDILSWRLVPKKSIPGLKMSLPVSFRFIAGEIFAKKIWKNQNHCLWIQGESFEPLLSHFWAIASFSPLSAFRRFWQLVPWLLMFDLFSPWAKANSCYNLSKVGHKRWRKVLGLGYCIISMMNKPHLYLCCGGFDAFLKY